MLCVECGKREAKYEGLCEECFLKKVKFTDLPQHLDLVVCPHCHSVKFGGVWERISLEEAISRIVDKNIKFIHDCDGYDLDIVHGEIEGEFDVEVRVLIKYGDLETTETHMVRFDLKYESCPRCNRYFGNYFEAILQLRGMRENEYTEVLEYTHWLISRHARKNENLFLTKEVKKKEGWDLYLSDKREAKNIAKELVRKYGAALKESPQIAGRKDGKDVYRVTYSVRLPTYRVGDVVNVEGKYYLVTDVGERYVHGVGVCSGKKKSFDSHRHSIDVVVTRDDIELATVIYSRNREAQIIDRNNEIIDVITNYDVNSGDTVRIFRVDESVYVLPDINT